MHRTDQDKQILGLMFVGNEDDILEQSIRHNIRYLDHLTVMIDMNSVDGSREILTKLIAEGLPIDIISRPPVLVTDFRNDFVNKNTAWAYVFIDDDEFICGVEPEILRKKIFDIATCKYIVMPWKTFIVNPDDYDCSDIPRSFKYARKFEEPQYYKAIYIRCNLEVPHTIAPGAHLVDGVEGVIINELKLAHYPVRSIKQLMLKYFSANMYFGIIFKNQTAPNYAYHQKQGFQKLVNGEFQNIESLYLESMSFCSERNCFSTQDFEELIFDFNYKKSINTKNESVPQLFAKMIDVLSPHLAKS